jgi:branched-chain amino acid transport system permease protein
VLFFAQVIVSGLTVGSLYALTALGFAIIFRATGVVNFAQGEMMMIGAIFALVLYQDYGLGYVPSFLLAMVAAWIMGALIERVAYRSLLTAPVFTVILSTVAVGQMLRSGVRIVRGDELSLFPPILSAQPFTWLGLSFTALNIGIVAISLGCLLGFVAFFRWTRIGWSMRATAQNKEAAALVGVSVPMVFSVSWGISAALAAAAGILVAPLITITPDMGVIGIKGFIAAIMGGYNSLHGAAAGGFLLGVLENLAGVYISSTFKDVVTFCVLIAMVIVRPAGLLGRRETRRV